MTATQRLPVSLTPLDVALARLLDGVKPVDPVEIPLALALGCIAADMSALNAQSGQRQGRCRWLGLACPRPRRRVVLFAIAIGSAAGLGRSRRPHAG